jgi:hypothetical protein
MKHLTPRNATERDATQRNAAEGAAYSKALAEDMP